VHVEGSYKVTHAAWPHMREQGYGRIIMTASSSGIYGNFGQANYGAAKMGMVGLMNVLEKEGRSKNVRVNTLAPAAETRLIGTIPGRDVNPDDPDPMRHPKLVTPAVLLMCGEDAPTGKIIQAGNGRFSCAAVFNNDDLQFDADVSYEDLLEQKDALLDMSGAEEGWTLMRKRRDAS
ncbi:MAG: SDR family NAD(P)-dependent oxidoreductase, partial [Pseudomonadales bacterium]|nr:SDR family NAD(P)-dependent oxidoreductase [Pseudomonadales bacterium]